MHNTNENTVPGEEMLSVGSIVISNTFMDDLIRKYSKYTMDVIFFSLTIMTTYLLSAENPIVNVSVTAFETLVGYRHQALRVHKHYEEKLMMQWVILKLFANTAKYSHKVTLYKKEIETITTSHWLLPTLPFGITLRGEDKAATRVGLLALLVGFIPAIVIHAKSISEQEEVSHLPLIVWVISFTFATAARYGNSSLLAKANQKLLEGITSIKNTTGSQQHQLDELREEAREIIKALHSAHDSSLRDKMTDLLIDIAKKNPQILSTQPPTGSAPHSSSLSPNEGVIPQTNRLHEMPSPTASIDHQDPSATTNNSPASEGSTFNHLYTVATNFYTTSSELVDNSMVDLARTINKASDEISNAAISWFSIRS